PDFVPRVPPRLGGVLHLPEFLFRERDQGRGVIDRLPVAERLERGRFGDQRLSRPGGSTDQHPLLGGKPGEECLLLDRVRGVGKLFEIFERQLVAVQVSLRRWLRLREDLRSAVECRQVAGRCERRWSRDSFSSNWTTDESESVSR